MKLAFEKNSSSSCCCCQAEAILKPKKIIFSMLHHSNIQPTEVKQKHSIR